MEKAKLVKEMRHKTGLSMLVCKYFLEKHQWVLKDAIDDAIWSTLAVNITEEV